jgi:uncharacterized protein YutE (UPF0331/DUF86 family)
MEKLPLDKEKIIERIEDIKNMVLELKKFQKMELEDFIKNKDFYPLASYYLRIAMEAVLTISTHILSRIPTNGKKKDYTQVILSLGDYGVLPKDFAQKLKGMAGYRNRLVHLYWKVIPKELLGIIKEDLSDFEEFIGHIEKFITK